MISYIMLSFFDLSSGFSCLNVDIVFLFFGFGCFFCGWFCGKSCGLTSSLYLHRPVCIYDDYSRPICEVEYAAYAACPGDTQAGCGDEWQAFLDCWRSDSRTDSAYKNAGINICKAVGAPGLQGAPGQQRAPGQPQGAPGQQQGAPSAVQPSGATSLGSTLIISYVHPVALISILSYFT